MTISYLVMSQVTLANVVMFIGMSSSGCDVFCL